MKKYITLLVGFLFATLSAGAYSGVYCRKVFDNGLYVQSDYIFMSDSHQHEISFSLIYETGQRDGATEGYSFIFRITSRDNSFNIPYEGKMLIKTSTDETLELTQCADGSIRYYIPETGYQSSFYPIEKVAIGNLHSLYQISGKYPISNGDLEKILNDGIIKIRVQTSKEYMDFEFPVEEKFSDDLFAKKTTENKGRYYFRKMNATLNENIDGKLTFTGGALPNTFLYTKETE